MAKRGPGPALYEMLKSRAVRADAMPPPVEAPRDREPIRAPAAPVQEAPLNWLGPGRTVRVPVGYAVLGAAVALIALLLAYIFGYERADSRKQAELDRLRSRLIEDDPAHLAVTDPLTAAQDANEGAASSMAPSGGAVGARIPGPIESEPREDGLNYFHLMYTTRDRAVEFANFCRSQGLEAYVVRSGKREGRAVITLPGFTSDARRSAAIRDLESRIKHAVGRWETQSPNEPKLDNPYVARYKK